MIPLGVCFRTLKFGWSFAMSDVLLAAVGEGDLRVVTGSVLWDRE